MNWTVDYGEYDPNQSITPFVELLIQGIEAGMGELEWLNWLGGYCEACGAWRVRETVDCNDVAPTDQGLEYRLMKYELCAECAREFRKEEPSCSS